VAFSLSILEKMDAEIFPGSLGSNDASFDASRLAVVFVDDPWKALHSTKARDQVEALEA